VKIFTVKADVEVVVYFLLQLTPHCLTKPMLVNIENKHRLFLFDTFVFGHLQTKSLGAEWLIQMRDHSLKLNLDLTSDYLIDEQ
jgi:hypothetical protein